MLYAINLLTYISFLNFNKKGCIWYVNIIKIKVLKEIKEAYSTSDFLDHLIIDIIVI